MTQTTVLLFDLGGVLVETATVESLRAMLRGRDGRSIARPTVPAGTATEHGPGESAPVKAARQEAALDDAALKDLWLRSPAVRDFERGLVSPEEFASLFLCEWGISEVSPNALLADVATWIRRPYPGAGELLDRLRDDYHVSCLSNCNEIHWTQIAPFLTHFDSAYSSHLLGAIKPDREVFVAVLTDLQVAAESVRFFDDSRANVEAARAVGMQATLVDGFDEVLHCLEEEGLLRGGVREMDVSR